MVFDFFGMGFGDWGAFAAACLIVLIIPGPTILLVVAYALSIGRTAALAVVAGVALGDLVAMTLSVIGLGALMQSSALLFSILKWIGAAYLIWLGFTLWRSRPRSARSAPWRTEPISARSPRVSPRASSMIDLPAPVSPLTTVIPSSSSRSSCSTIA